MLAPDSSTLGILVDPYTLYIYLTIIIREILISLSKAHLDNNSYHNKHITLLYVLRMD